MAVEQAAHSDDPKAAFKRAVYNNDLHTMRMIHAAHPGVIGLEILVFAAQRSGPEAIRLMGEFGADMNEQDVNGWTALKFAVSYGNLENAKALLDSGADPNLHVPLFNAARSNKPEHAVPLAKMLLEYGADINQPIIVQGMPTRNALTEALAVGNSDLAEFLKRRGASQPGELPGGGTMQDAVQPSGDLFEHIFKHLTKYFGKPLTGSIQEIVPVSDYPIAVHYIPAGRKDPWAYLFTLGLSSYEMRVPKGAESYRRAELLVAVPSSWPAPEAAIVDPRFAWPIQWLRKIARYPLENGTWLGPEWTVIANGDPPEPLGEGIEFTAWGIAAPDTDKMRIEIDKQQQVRIYQMFPLYTEEYLLERRQGFASLMKQFEEIGLPEGIKPGRPNVAT